MFIHHPGHQDQNYERHRTATADKKRPHLSMRPFRAFVKKRITLQQEQQEQQQEQQRLFSLLLS